MFKNKLSKMLLAAICALVLGASLAACSSNTPASSSGNSSPSASSSSKADPAADFPGEWKLAAMDYQGLIAVGDFEQGELSEYTNFKLAAKEDGTGSLSMGDESVTFKWVPKGDTVAITWDKEESNGKVSMEYLPEEGVVKFTSNDEKNVAAYLTKDGKYKDYEAIVMANAKPISDAKKLEGKWDLTGVGVMGMTMFGTADDIKKVVGEEASTTMVFNADGTGSFEAGAESQPFTWSVSNDGAVVNLDMLGTMIACPVVSYDDSIILDMSSIFGGAMEMYYIYEAA